MLRLLCSSFTDIFDVNHFIEVLQDEISIVKELPSMYSWSTRDYYGTGIRPTRIKTAPVHASANWYLENVLPMLNRFVIQFSLATVIQFWHKQVKVNGFLSFCCNLMIQCVAI